MKLNIRIQRKNYILHVSIWIIISKLICFSYSLCHVKTFGKQLFFKNMWTWNIWLSTWHIHDIQSSIQTWHRQEIKWKRIIHACNGFLLQKFLNVLDSYWVFLRKFGQHFLYESFALSSLIETENKEKQRKENSCTLSRGGAIHWLDWARSIFFCFLNLPL